MLVGFSWYLGLYRECEVEAKNTHGKFGGYGSNWLTGTFLTGMLDRNRFSAQRQI